MNIKIFRLTRKLCNTIATDSTVATVHTGRALIGFNAAAGAVAVAFGSIAVVAGLTVGAVGGATLDSQEQVAVASVQLYEVNKILPALQRDYLARADLEARSLRLDRQENPAINFVPVVLHGNRYTLGPGGV